jgi:hypothetical protein
MRSEDLVSLPDWRKYEASVDAFLDLEALS